MSSSRRSRLESRDWLVSCHMTRIPILFMANLLGMLPFFPFSTLYFICFFCFLLFFSLSLSLFIFLSSFFYNIFASIRRPSTPVARLMTDEYQQNWITEQEKRIAREQQQEKVKQKLKDNMKNAWNSSCNTLPPINLYHRKRQRKSKQNPCLLPKSPCNPKSVPLSTKTPSPFSKCLNLHLWAQKRALGGSKGILF